MESTKKIRKPRIKERQVSKVTSKFATWLTRKMEWLLTEMVQGFQWSRLEERMTAFGQVKSGGRDAE